MIIFLSQFLFICLVFQSKGFPIGVMRFYKKSLQAKLDASFLTHSLEGKDCIIREAKQVIQEKVPKDPACLVTSKGFELPVDFTMLDYCLGLRLTQPSRVKFAHKLFLINEDEFKGKLS